MKLNRNVLKWVPLKIEREACRSGNFGCYGESKDKVSVTLGCWMEWDEWYSVVCRRHTRTHAQGNLCVCTPCRILVIAARFQEPRSSRETSRMGNEAASARYTCRFLFLLLRIYKLHKTKRIRWAWFQTLHHYFNVEGSLGDSSKNLSLHQSSICGRMCDTYKIFLSATTPLVNAHRLCDI